MDTVYVETTIPSYLAAHPSRDLIVAANQQVTHTWWRTAADRFELCVSETVLDEIGAGDADMAALRLELVDGMQILRQNEDVNLLLEEYRVGLRLRGRAEADLPHIAFAVAFEMDFLVTWNCKHIANGKIIQKLRRINSRLGRSTPQILTPSELIPLEEGDDE